MAVDGVIYIAVGFSVIYAVDAASGKQLWSYDPKVAPQKMRMAWGIRGLSFWKGKVIAGVQDGRLFALDAQSGKLLWETLTTQPGDNRYITGAPRVFNGKVIIGHGGADFGHVRGYVSTYDAETGTLLWRWYIVPGDPAKGFENKAMEMAAKTWKGQWWKYGGGGTAWNAMTYDPDYNRVYIGTGNGGPWNRKLRSPGGGDNLFLCSVVALDADTGQYIWHYQTAPGESWDFTSTMDLVLANILIDGKPRKVILHAPKNGFFYVIDRATGKLISADKLGKVTWAKGIDMATGRPIENPGVRYEDGEALMWPGSGGLHNWQPMSFSPDTGLTYIPAHEMAGYYNDKGLDPRTYQMDRDGPMGINAFRDDIPKSAGSSSLIAWDAVQKKKAWETALARRHQRRRDEHPRRPRVPGPVRRPVRRPRRQNRRGVVECRYGCRHPGAADHLQRRRPAVRVHPRRLGRWPDAARLAQRPARLGRPRSPAPIADLRARWPCHVAAVAAAVAAGANRRSPRSRSTRSWSYGAVRSTTDA